nr:MAG TPA: hypothetical protein [Caudoviricetes sp.]
MVNYRRLFKHSLLFFRDNNTLYYGTKLVY